MIIRKFRFDKDDNEDCYDDTDIYSKDKHATASLKQTKNMAATYNTTVRCGQGYRGCDCNRCKYANKACPRIKVIYRKKG